MHRKLIGPVTRLAGLSRWRQADTLYIADQAVTTPKIDGDAVLAEKIQDGAVTTAKIHSQGAGARGIDEESGELSFTDTYVQSNTFGLDSPVGDDMPFLVYWRVQYKSTVAGAQTQVQVRHDSSAIWTTDLSTALTYQTYTFSWFVFLDSPGSTWSLWVHRKAGHSGTHYVQERIFAVLQVQR
jgi:hypothetical protein